MEEKDAARMANVGYDTVLSAVEDAPIYASEEQRKMLRKMIKADNRCVGRGPPKRNEENALMISILPSGFVLHSHFDIHTLASSAPSNLDTVIDTVFGLLEALGDEEANDV